MHIASMDVCPNQMARTSWQKMGRLSLPFRRKHYEWHLLTEAYFYEAAYTILSFARFEKVLCLVRFMFHLGGDLNELMQISPHIKRKQTQQPLRIIDDATRHGGRESLKYM